MVQDLRLIFPQREKWKLHIIYRRICSVQRGAKRSGGVLLYILTRINLAEAGT